MSPAQCKLSVTLKRNKVVNIKLLTTLNKGLAPVGHIDRVI